MIENNRIERFSIRKLTIGAVSIGIGLCAATLSGTTVKADTLPIENTSQVEQVKTSDDIAKQQITTVNVENATKQNESLNKSNETNLKLDVATNDTDKKVTDSDKVNDKKETTTNIDKAKSLADTTVVNLPEQKVLINQDPSAYLNYYTEKSIADGLNALKLSNTNLLSSVKFNVDEESHNYLVIFDDKSIKKISFKDVLVQSLVSSSKLNSPEFPVVVNNSAKLTDKEKDTIKNTVISLNPQSVKNVVFKNDYYQPFDIIFKDGSQYYGKYQTSELTINFNAWILNRQSSSVSKDIKIPDNKLKVKDINKLTFDEQEQLKKNLKKINPLADDISISPTGVAKIVFNFPPHIEYINSEELIQGPLPLADTIKVILPKEKILIDQNPSDYITWYNEKKVGQGLNALKLSNSDLLSSAKFDVDTASHNYLITFKDNSIKKIPFTDVLIQSLESSIKLNTPEFPILVKNCEKLTEDEMESLRKMIISLNSSVVNDVKFDPAPKVIYKDASWIYLSTNNKDANSESNPWILNYGPTKHPNVNIPSNKLKVKDINNLTDMDRNKLKEILEKANPLADRISINFNGVARIDFNYPQDTEYIVPSELLSDKPESLAEKTMVMIPSKKTIWNKPYHENYDEKALIKGLRNIQSANLVLAHKVKFDIDTARQSYVLTFEDDSTKLIPFESIFVNSMASSITLNKPDFPIIVNDQYSLTKNEKDKIKQLILKTNPNKHIKDVKFTDAFNTGGEMPFTVIFEDGSSIGRVGAYLELNVDDWIYSKEYDKNYDNDITSIKLPTKKLVVKEPSHLSKDEIDTLTEKLEDLNPFVYTISVSPEGEAKFFFKYPDVTRYVEATKLVTDGKEEISNTDSKDKNTNTSINPNKDSKPNTPSKDDQSKDSSKPSNPTTPSVDPTPVTPSHDEQNQSTYTPIENNSQSSKNSNSMNDQVKKQEKVKSIITERAAVTGIIHAPIISNNPNYKIALLDENGNYTGQYINTNSNWKYFEVAIIKGRLCYRLGSSKQWIPADYLNGSMSYQNGKFVNEIKYQNIGYVSALKDHPTWKIALYDTNGKITSYLNPNSSWKIFAKKVINGQLMYRLGTQKQWIPAKYISIK